MRGGGGEGEEDRGGEWVEESRGHHQAVKMTRRSQSPSKDEHRQFSHLSKSLHSTDGVNPWSPVNHPIPAGEEAHRLARGGEESKRVERGGERGEGEREGVEIKRGGWRERRG